LFDHIDIGKSFSYDFNEVRASCVFFVVNEGKDLLELIFG